MKKIFVLLIAAIIGGFAMEAQTEKLPKSITSLDDKMVGLRHDWFVRNTVKEKDFNKLIERFDKLIAKGKEDAPLGKLHLADLYSVRSPKYMRKPAESFRLFNEAANEITDDYPYQRNVALYNIGDCYYRGYGVEQNMDSAYRYFAEVASVEPRLGIGLAEMYLYGNGVEQDIPFAIAILNEAQQNGQYSGLALYYLGMYLMDQQEKGTLDEKAYEIFKEAAFLYSLDLEKSIALYEQSAEMGFAPAQFDLGTAHLNHMVYHPTGIFGDRDPRGQELAEKWLLKAAEQDYIAAVHNYGVAMELKGSKRNVFGFITSRDPQNEQTALRYYRRAAEAGNPDSQVSLGLFYQYGWGGYPIDYEKAFELYDMAYAQGYPRGKEMADAFRTLIKEERIKALQESVANFNNALRGFSNSLGRVLQKKDDRKIVSRAEAPASGAEQQASATNGGKRRMTSGSASTLKVAYSTANRLLKDYANGRFSYTMDDVREAQQSMREIRTKLENGGWHMRASEMESWNGVR